MLESAPDNKLVRWIAAHVSRFYGHVTSFGQLMYVHKLCFLTVNSVIVQISKAKQAFP